MQGLLDSSISIEIIAVDKSSDIKKKEVVENRDFVKQHWMFGPEKTQQPNSDFWRKIATVWRISPEQAKRNLCANCEYFNDSPDMLAEMEAVPEDAYDKDGGGRGWCGKFEFICHNLRTCQAWEKAEVRSEEGEDYSNGEDDGDDESED